MFVSMVDLQDYATNYQAPKDEDAEAWTEAYLLPYMTCEIIERKHEHWKKLVIGVLLLGREVMP